MKDFSNLKNKTKEVKDFFEKELSAIRTGRAATAMLDSIMVDAYGSKMSIKELASINLEDPKTIRVEPYDLSIIKDIERAIATSNLGLGSSPYEKGVRIIFPELTSERRDEFVKLTRKKLEESKISLRNVRDKEWSQIQDDEKSGEISEDMKFRLKEEMQKIIDETSKGLDEMALKKEKEIKQ